MTAMAERGAGLVGPTLRKNAPGAGGVLALLLFWELIGRSGLLGPAFPAPSQVLAALVDSRAVLADALASTTAAAALGLAGGATIAILMAATRQIVQATREGLDRLAATVHAVPLIVVAPLLTVAIGREQAPIAVSIVAAFFPTYVAATKAFASPTVLQQDLFTILGSNRLNRTARLLAPSALPDLCDAMRLGAPAAVLGAVMGEWFGAPRGLGLVILSSAQNYQIDQLWAAATLATVLALTGYLIFTLLRTAARRRFT